ncbi:MAG: succinyl-diaminopimelate desuccinylase [Thiotrichaceae bacterium]|nr:succinyl-diaminopimelate desuccinylase [Thiotrichaceae bacterium]
MSPTLALTLDLLQRASLTPDDAGCQPLLAERLRPLGFKIEPLRFADVDNLWARFGDAAPLFVFAGHTDVVPTGDVSAWKYPPFTPTIDEHGMLYGRGAADMKGGIAAFVTACERFLAKHPQPKGSIALLITSDEEGPSINGTVKVVEHLEARHEKMNWCLVGEPTSGKLLGDTVKNGRRGSLTGYLTIEGVQGHVAYPHLADNPIHRFAPALQALCDEVWDNGNEFFPPTTFQISNIHAGMGATNVIPQTLDVVFNFRHSTAVTKPELQERVAKILETAGLKYQLKWVNSGEAFLTANGELLSATQQAIQEICGVETELSTSGGTSDGRFIAPTGAQVLELGVLNATIHKVNEAVAVQDLDNLSLIYERILEKLLG